VGCGSAPDVAACLRSPTLTAATIFTVAGLGYQYGGFGTIAPTLDGTTLTMPLLRALKHGRVNRVPVSAGVDRDENLSGSPVTAADYTAYVQAQFGPIADQVLDLYPLDRFLTPCLAFRTVVADS
jgi:para-nitrobenzyl esterase